MNTVDMNRVEFLGRVFGHMETDLGNTLLRTVAGRRKYRGNSEVFGR